MQSSHYNLDSDKRVRNLKQQLCRIAVKAQEIGVCIIAPTASSVTGRYDSPHVPSTSTTTSNKTAIASGRRVPSFFGPSPPVRFAGYDACQTVCRKGGACCDKNYECERKKNPVPDHRHPHSCISSRRKWYTEADVNANFRSDSVRNDVSTAFSKADAGESFAFAIAAQNHFVAVFQKTALFSIG